jgi:hypothetical protein
MPREQTMTLDQFHDLKVWHSRHAGDRPLEGHVWNGVLTLWVAGWVGLPAAWLSGMETVAVLCLALLVLPQVYVAARRQLHRRHLLRCDWIAALG